MLCRAMIRITSTGITAALFTALVLLPAPPASAQSRDEFSYWDANRQRRPHVL